MNPVGLPTDGFWIYLIINRVNNKVYVGKTRNPYVRCHQYLAGFRDRDTHRMNTHLLNAMYKDGIEQFLYRVWELCSDADHLAARELFWIDRFETTDRKKGYNLRRDSSTGMITHPETSAKIRTNLLRQHAAGMRADHGAKLSARWAATPERREVQADVMRRTLTKYAYRISNGKTESVCSFAELSERGLRNAVVSFARLRVNMVCCKGYTVERIALCQNTN